MNMCFAAKTRTVLASVVLSRERGSVVASMPILSTRSFFEEDTRCLSVMRLAATPRKRTNPNRHE